MGAFLKVQGILARIASESAAQRLARSRNRVPTVLSSPYGASGRGWTR